MKDYQYGDIIIEETRPHSRGTSSAKPKILVGLEPHFNRQDSITSFTVPRDAIDDKTDYATFLDPETGKTESVLIGHYSLKSEGTDGEQTFSFSQVNDKGEPTDIKKSSLESTQIKHTLFPRSFTATLMEKLQSALTIRDKLVEANKKAKQTGG